MARIKGLGFAALLVLTPAFAVNTFNAEGVVNNVKDKEKNSPSRTAPWPD